MPTRRLQLTGKSTFTVSLPKRWARSNRLAAGAELSIEEEKDGALRVSIPSVNAAPEEAGIRVSAIPSPEGLRRVMIAKYLRGYGSIRISSPGLMPAEFRLAAKAQAEMLVGMRVVEENDEELVLQDFFSPVNLSIPKILKWSYSIASGMHSDSVKALLEGDTALAGKVSASENEVDKVRHQITRQLNLAIANPSRLSALSLSSADCLDLRLVTENVEEIGDAAMEIAGLARQGRPAGKEAAEFARHVTAEAFAMHADALKAFYSKGPAALKAADSVVSRQAKLSRRIHDAENELIARKERPAWLTTFTSESLKIGGYGAEIAKIVIDQGA